MAFVLLVVLFAGFIAAFILSFAMGANDVANAFGTSVGSKVLTLKQAVIVASIFETLGSVLVGYQVTDTVRKGIVDIGIYDTKERAIQLAFGALATLIASLLWLLIATVRKLPVSTSHAIVGATLGFSLVMHGAAGVHWKVLGFIALSWIISPVLAGIVSAVLFYTVQTLILRKPDPITPGLQALPMIYAVAIFINALAILLNGSRLLHLQNVPVWLAIAGSSGIALAVMIGVGAWVVPWQRRKIEQKATADEEAAKQATSEAAPLKVADVVPEVLQVENGKIPQTALQPVEQNGYAHHSKAKNAETALNEPNLDPSSNLSPNNPPTSSGTARHSTLSNGTNYGTPSSLPGETAACVENSATLTHVNGLEKVIDVYRSDSLKYKSVDAQNIETASDMLQKSDPPKTKLLFSFVQILTACCASFAHGGNDVSNSIGPLVTIWLIYETGSISVGLETPLWILFFGGVGISLGLLMLGRRVIETIGTELTATMTPSSGFCIELGTVTTVLLASKLGVPISTTHCIVGSVIAVGYLRSKRHVDFKLLRSICFAWVVTLPATVAFSAAIMLAFRFTLPYF